MLKIVLSVEDLPNVVGIERAPRILAEFLSLF